MIWDVDARGGGGDAAGGEGDDVGSIGVRGGIIGGASLPKRKRNADPIRGLLIIDSGSTAEPFCEIAVHLFGIGAASFWLIL